MCDECPIYLNKDSVLSNLDELDIHYFRKEINDVRSR
jgi:hypothetical protein